MSVQLGLIVAGGLIELYDDEFTDVVEIFQADILYSGKRQTLFPEFTATFINSSNSLFDNVCYALGETDGKQSDLEDATHPKALYASVDDLISNVMLYQPIRPSNAMRSFCVEDAITHSILSTSFNCARWLFSGSRWMENIQERSLIKGCLYYILSFTEFMDLSYVSDFSLSYLLHGQALQLLLWTEWKYLLVIGGQGGDDNRVSTVYKGSMNLKL